MCLTLEAMCSYQVLCPDIFLRVNFSPAKLLPPFPPVHDQRVSKSHDHVSRSHDQSHDHPSGDNDDHVSPVPHQPSQDECVQLALQINLNAYEESFNKVGVKISN